METTFITIHDLSQDARIRYASDSIEEVLGYMPYEVVHKSCWEYFHPDEIPFARTVHGRGVELDKAAVLNYCLVRHKNGAWIGCECVFTVVYDVLVACTSIYQRGNRSQKRAADAPIVRKLFTSSPRDPRYHMLSYISNKFSSVPRSLSHEPRAALFVNRFTRTATIMHATNGVQEILGLDPQHLVSKSFYYCIQERCLRDAVRCLESAKANDSIAYLRFWYRNPLEDDDPQQQRREASHIQSDRPNGTLNGASPRDSSSRTTTTNGFGSGFASRSGSSELSDPERELELEAVVSCTSDGLVVILRRARPLIPTLHPTQKDPVYANGLFASPWAIQPVYSHPDPVYSTNEVRYPHLPNQFARYQGGPNYSHTIPRPAPVQVQASAPAPESSYGTAPPYFATNPPVASSASSLPMKQNQEYMHNQFLLNTIREVAVFAWGIIGINNSLEKYKRGIPKGESMPPKGFQYEEAALEAWA